MDAASAADAVVHTLTRSGISAVTGAGFELIMSWEVGDPLPEAAGDAAIVIDAVALVAGAVQLEARCGGGGDASAFWSAIAAATPEPRKAVHALVQIAVLRASVASASAGEAPLAARGAEVVPDDGAAQAALARALAAVRWYCALCAFAGISSSALVDAGLMRRSLWLLKKCVDASGEAAAAPPARATARPGAKRRGGAGVGARGGAGAKRARPSRRAADGDGGSDYSGSDDGGDSDGAGGGGGGGDSDDAPSTPVRRGGTRSRRVPPGGDGGEGGDVDASAAAGVVEHDVATLLADYRVQLSPVNVLAATRTLAALVGALSLQLHPQLLPTICDVVASITVLPVKPPPSDAYMPPPQGGASRRGVAAPPSAGAQAAAWEALHVAARDIVGCLVQPLHGSPLTLARLLCKRIKPLLTDGTLPMSAVATASAAALDDAIDGAIAEAAAAGPGAAITSAATTKTRVQPAIVRRRATVLVEAIIHTPSITSTVVASVAMPASPSAVDGDADVSVDTLGLDAHDGPAGVAEVASAPSSSGAGLSPASLRLARLPAVTALLQHLALWCTTAKADARADVLAIVAQLRRQLPHSLRRAWLRFLMRLARSAKAPHRLVAVEAAGAMLSSSPADFAAVMQEASAPSAAEAAEEGPGYGSEASEYAGGVLASGDGEVLAAGVAPEAIASDADAGATEGPGTPAAASRRKARSRRSSICSLTPQSLKLGARDDSPAEAEARTPTAATAGAGAAASPFYRSGVRRASSLGPTLSRRASSRLNASVIAREVGGCADPRPTLWAVIHLLLHRCSDKSPVVRGRALTTLSDALQPAGEADPAAPVARSFAVSALSDFIARVHWLAHQRKREVGSASEITLADVAASTTILDGTAGMDTSMPATPSRSGERTADGGDGEEGGEASAAMAQQLAVSWSPLTRCHALVPLLCRRMEEDARPLIKRAAVASLVSLSQMPPVGFLVAPRLQHTLAEAAELADGGDELAGLQAASVTAAVREHMAAVQAHVAAGAAMAATLQHAHTAAPATSDGTDDDDDDAMTGATGAAAAVAVVRRDPVRMLGLHACQMLAAAATDASVLVRKSAVVAVDTMLRADGASPVTQRLWLATVLPGVFDAEATVVAKAVEAINNVVLAPLAAAAPRARRGGAAAEARKRASTDAGGASTEAPIIDAMCASPASLTALSLLCACDGDEDLEASLRQAVALLCRTLAPRTAGGAGAPAASIHFHLAHSIGAAMAAIDATTVPAGMAPLPMAAIARAGWVLLTALTEATLPDGASKALTAIGVPPATITAACKPLRAFAATTWLAMAAAAPAREEMAVDGAPDSTMVVAAADETAASITLHLPATTADISTAAGVASASDGTSSARTFAACAARCLRVLALAYAAGAVGSAPASAASLDSLVASLSRGCCMLAWDANVLGPALRALFSMSSEFLAAGSALLTAASAMEAVLARYIQAIAAASSPAASAAIVVAGGHTVARALFVLGEVGMLAATTTAAGTATAPYLTASQVKLVQTLLAPTVTARGAEVPLPDVLRAHAYLTVGKISLGDAAVAQRFAPVFVRDLSPARSPEAVRNNIMVVLGDLLVRYTGLVDKYVPTMVLATADPSPLVRQHAITLFTGLVASEYVKMRAALAVRIALALADPDDAVRSVAETAVHRVLAGRFRGAFVSHFTHIVFAACGCARKLASATTDVDYEAGDEAAAAAPGAGIDSAAAAAMSPLLAGARIAVYRALLSSFSEEQRLTVYGRLCNDVLGGVADGSLDPSDSGTGVVVMDTLAVLSMWEMRGAALTGHGRGGRGGAAGAGADADAELLEGEDEMAGAEAGGGASAATMQATVLAAARSRVVGKLAKRQIVEGVLPLALAMRAKLASTRSPLAPLLTAYLAALLEDFGTDIRDALAADRTLLAELEYDVRQWKSSQGLPSRGKTGADASTMAATTAAPAAGGMASPRLKPKGARAAAAKSGEGGAAIADLGGAFADADGEADKENVGAGAGVACPAGKKAATTAGGKGAGARKGAAAKKPPRRRAKAADSDDDDDGSSGGDSGSDGEFRPAAAAVTSKGTRSRPTRSQVTVAMELDEDA